MPLIKSAIKKMKQDIKRTKRNNVFRNRMRTDMKTLATGAHDGAENLKDLLVKAQSSIDIAAKKNLIKKNNASRKKARMAKMVNAVHAKA